MRYFQLRLSESLHRRLKVAAAEAGMTMHEFVLSCVFGDDPPEVA